ncbi:NUDIX domain-containing protein [Blastococcus sp. TF02A-35]|nr:NUDIX domain-containing protein [Blastococcus sp. TF02A_35]
MIGTGTVVAGVLIRDGRLLLCHRSKGRVRYPDYWSLPGGKVEPGESSRDALRRELREEIGVDAAISRDGPLQAIRDDAYVVEAWFVDQFTGEPVNAAPEEHSAIAWVGAAELKYLRLAHPEHLSLLIRTLEGRSGTPRPG